MNCAPGPSCPDESMIDVRRSERFLCCTPDAVTEQVVPPKQPALATPIQHTIVFTSTATKQHGIIQLQTSAKRLWYHELQGLFYTLHVLSAFMR